MNSCQQIRNHLVIRACFLLICSTCSGYSSHQSCVWSVACLPKHFFTDEDSIQSNLLVCGCRSYNNLNWDLTTLIRHKPQRDYVIERGGWKFYMNPCSDTLRTPASCGQQLSREAPGFQTLSKNGEEACYALGVPFLFDAFFVFEFCCLRHLT